MRTTLALFLSNLVVAFTLLGCQSTSAAQPRSEIAPVVFVCEHGSVKSLIAASLFNKVADERGLPFRALSRGLTPDASVPPTIVQILREEGIEIENFKPSKLTSVDVSTASRVIAIGVDLSPFNSATGAPVERWNDLPASASADYAVTRAAMLGHIETILDQLQARR